MSFKKPFRAVPIRLGPLHVEQQRRRSRSFAARLLGGAVAAGLAIGVVSSLNGAGVVRRPPPPDPREKSGGREAGPGVYYYRCDEARAAGAAPIYRGQPGYRPGLDADGDGIACEPYRGRR
jgi:hypothetical protein